MTIDGLAICLSRWQFPLDLEFIVGFGEALSDGSENLLFKSVFDIADSFAASHKRVSRKFDDPRDDERSRAKLTFFIREDIQVPFDRAPSLVVSLLGNCDRNLAQLPLLDKLRRNWRNHPNWNDDRAHLRRLRHGSVRYQVRQSTSHPLGQV